MSAVQGHRAIRILAFAGSILSLQSGGTQEIDLSAFRTSLPEYGLVKGPDGFYISRHVGPWGQSSASSIALYRHSSALPETPAWAIASANESDFHYSGAQETGCFISDRKRDANYQSADIWCVRWLGTGWSKPAPLPEPVNSSATEFSPYLTDDGTLFFASDREGGAGLGDLFRADHRSGAWTVEPLGPAVNSPAGEWNVAVSPDGRSLVFERSHGWANRSVPGDLYVSKRRHGAWDDAVPLSRLNTDHSDLMPRFIDRDVMTFASSSGPDVDVRLTTIDELEVTAPALAAVSRSRHEVVLLDTRSLETIRKVTAGIGPHEISAGEDGRVAVLPSHGIHPEDHAGPIPHNQMRWLTNPSSGVTTIDLTTGMRTADFALEDCERPHGVATTPQAHVAWITCEIEGKILEFDVPNGRTLRIFQVFSGVHKVMHLASKKTLIASSPGIGAVALIDLNSGHIATVRTGHGAEALAADAGQSTVYVANGQDGTACRVDIQTRSVQWCAPTGGAFPIALAVDEARGVLWIANSASSSLTALGLHDGTQRWSVPLPSRPLGLALDVRASRLFVGLPRQNAVIAIDVVTRAIAARSDDVGEVDDLDLLPAGHFRSAPDT